MAKAPWRRYMVIVYGVRTRKFFTLWGAGRFCDRYLWQDLQLSQWISGEWRRLV